jgi:acetylornithine deacetylase
VSGAAPDELVVAEVERRREEIVDLLAELVRIPSVSGPVTGDELACQRFVEGTLRRMGLEVDVFTPDEVPDITRHPGWWPGHDYRDRPNVVGRRRGAGGGRSLLLAAHVDVFPEGPVELWRHGPFTPTLEGDALVGRGANDDKGGLAAQIMALDCIESAGLRLAGDVILASVVDEESGGANGALAVLQRPYDADAAIYCDGIDLDIHTASLGVVNARVEARIQPSAADRRVDHTMPVALAIYERLRAYADARRNAFADDPVYRDTLWPRYAARISLVKVGSADGSDPAGICIDIGAYVLPGEEPADVLAAIGRLAREAAAPFGDLLAQPPSVVPVSRVMPPSSVPPDDPFVELVARAYAQATGRAARVRGSAPSDLFQFRLNGVRRVPSLGMGPGRWAVDGAAHEANESVLVEGQLLPFVKTLALTMIEWCGVA